MLKIHNNQPWTACLGTNSTTLSINQFNSAPFLNAAPSDLEERVEGGMNCTPSGEPRVKEVIGRFLRFCVVGGTGVVVDMGVLYLLADPGRLGWDLMWSKLLAAELALLNNFLWNEGWTFRDLARARPGFGARVGRLTRFNLICVLGIGLSAALLNGQVRWLGMNMYAANLVAITVMSVWNFWLNLKFGWRSQSRASVV